MAPLPSIQADVFGHLKGQQDQRTRHVRKRAGAPRLGIDVAL